eukprot:Clim_evm44s22 gene=Clim_evmTU44s22
MYKNKINIEQLTSHAEVVEKFVEIAETEGQEDPFFVVDLGQVKRKFNYWKELLPRVEPHYAVKCNPDPKILETLAKLGSDFDCASATEMKMVTSLGVDPERIVYAHPCKPASHVKYAAANNVNLTVFDNETELYKMKELHPDSKLLLRVLTDNSRARCNLGIKFGSTLDRVPGLLALAKELELEVAGVCFHVGSGCTDSIAYLDAVEVAKSVFEMGIEAGHNMRILDIGGGFPGAIEDGVTFEDIVRVVNVALDRYFPEEEYGHVRIIAEPGRYMAASSHVLLANVIAKRIVPRDVVQRADGEEITSDDHPAFMYYLNDGVYASFNCILYDHATVNPIPYSESALRTADSTFQSSLWGPTCDGLDCITKDTLLPELEVGDWLIFENMGAYTNAAGSAFNGFTLAASHYLDTTAEPSA